MATMVLQYAGAAAGGLFGPAGAMIGRAAGAIAGSVIDDALFGGARAAKGPRLDDLRVMSSSEGAPIPVVWGRARLSGQVIWATEMEEEITTSGQTGGKGADGGSSSATTEYSYYANFAVGLCEGPIAALGRAWADGKAFDLSAVTWRLHTGSETQAPDSLIIARQGADDAPAYRGLAYVVFERLPLAKYGNRIPQLSFEVLRGGGSFEKMIKAVAVIPGATEFGYDTRSITRDLGGGASVTENSHASASTSDWTQSLDQLQDLCTGLQSVSLTVSWFGSDLRCGHCLIEPRVDDAGKATKPGRWSVAGLTRANARLTSRTASGTAVFGGTPSDASVVRALADLKSRGLKTVFYPFILMDIPPDNSLIDPYGGTASQPAYPWRGRITCCPAPGETESPDQTAAIDEQLTGFFGTACAQDFHTSGGSVTYTGPDEWSFRRFILHYAALCRLAGGVDAFLIGSELPGVTRLRNGAASFPVVAELVSLAAEVKSLLPEAKLSYGADWSEYFGYHPADGSGDVFFHLDPLWSASAVDFIAIDNYFPLADWRDGTAHRDRLAGYPSIYSLDYLQSNIEGGEYYDWHYPSSAERNDQERRPIADGAYGRPWVFRCKDLRNWWSNLHYERTAGVENARATQWIPFSKPIWFSELGCPAVDKGANQPNCFYDPKSAESALPHYSLGHRDDYMQRRHLEAVLAYWHEDSGRNPVSPLYGGPMVDVGHIFVWAWDARPFPHFPYLADTWSDGGNYELGHWLNGRAGAAPLVDLVDGILRHYGYDDAETAGLEGIVDGYVIDNVMSARDALEPLARGFAFDAVESAGRIRFLLRTGSSLVSLEPGACVEQAADKPLFTLCRRQETELPAAIKLTYVEPARDYRQAAVESRRSTGASRRETVVALPVMLSQAAAQAAADRLLFETWTARETANLVLPPSHLALEPGDVVTLFQEEGGPLELRIDEISEGYARTIKATQVDAELYALHAGAVRPGSIAAAAAPGEPLSLFMELPQLTSSSEPYGLWAAACAEPWGGLAVYRRSGSRFELNRRITAPATMGETLDPLPWGPPGRRLHAEKLRLRLHYGALQSISDEELLNGGNLAAIGSPELGFELVQFETATLVAPSTYEITSLLRGQLGSAPEIHALRPAGASFVRLDEATVQLAMRSADLGLVIDWRVGPASRNLGDITYREETASLSGLALRPLAPCQLRARRSGDDVLFTWIRQTRIDGDSWELAEVPLAEEFENYELTIHDAGAVRRSVSLGEPFYRYRREDQLADFGESPAVFTIAVAQRSAAYGLGAAAEATLHI